MVTAPHCVTGQPSPAACMCCRVTRSLLSSRGARPRPPPRCARTAFPATPRAGSPPPVAASGCRRRCKTSRAPGSKWGGQRRSGDKGRRRGTLIAGGKPECADFQATRTDCREPGSGSFRGRRRAAAASRAPAAASRAPAASRGATKGLQSRAPAMCLSTNRLPKAEEQGADPFGSGLAVHQHGLGCFLKAHNLEHSMSRRGNCHDNAVAESFFSLHKRERIRDRTDKTRVEPRQNVSGHIEMFHNPPRKHVRNGMLSPVEFERQQRTRPRVSRKHGAIHRDHESQILPTSASHHAGALVAGACFWPPDSASGPQALDIGFVKSGQRAEEQFRVLAQ